MMAGALWERVLERTERALRSGALQSIPTESQFVEDGRVRFLVRQVAGLVRKDQARQAQHEGAASAGQPISPFLPYEEELFVADISDTHLCLLNKFNVVEHHILIVTRRLEDQECLLDGTDFEALWTCLQELDGLGFYNGGEIAGASQRHKHLQMVPLPLAPVGPRVPIEPLLTAARISGGVGDIHELPFLHAFSRHGAAGLSPRDAAQRLLTGYHCLLSAVGILGEATESCRRQSAPYNLVVTRDWMLLAPRSRELFDGISVNALGYAGALLVRDERQMALVRQHGPMAVLREVGLPPAAAGERPQA
jgi:sulfate adenylyltransferase (ADP) / ATP adenylyltransferase